MSSQPVIVRPVPYRLASAFGVLLALVGACLYYLTRPPARPDPANVITYLETVTPFWPALFGLAALGVVVALVARRGRHIAHLVAAGVLAAYAFALAYTAVSTGAGWVTACFAVGLTVHTVALAASYTAR